jgi:hypothetical protein
MVPLARNANIYTSSADSPSFLHRFAFLDLSLEEKNSFLSKAVRVGTGRVGRPRSNELKTSKRDTRHVPEECCRTGGFTPSTLNSVFNQAWRMV